MRQSFYKKEHMIIRQLHFDSESIGILLENGIKKEIPWFD